MTLTGPRQVPAAIAGRCRPSASVMTGALVSILSVMDFQASLMPALSVARYSKVWVPLAVIRGGVAVGGGRCRR